MKMAAPLEIPPAAATVASVDEETAVKSPVFTAAIWFSTHRMSRSFRLFLRFRSNDSLVIYLTVFCHFPVVSSRQMKKGRSLLDKPRKRSNTMKTLQRIAWVLALFGAVTFAEAKGNGGKGGGGGRTGNKGNGSEVQSGRHGRGGKGGCQGQNGHGGSQGKNGYGKGRGQNGHGGSQGKNGAGTAGQPQDGEEETSE
jgi:hypothetical protein